MGFNNPRMDLKDSMRMSAFLIRPTIASTQRMMEQFLNFAVNQCYNPLIRTILEKNNVGDTFQKDFQYIEIDLNPIPYLNTDELVLLQNYGTTFENIVKMVFGDEFQFVTQNASGLDNKKQKSNGERDVEKDNNDDDYDDDNKKQKSNGKRDVEKDNNDDDYDDDNKKQKSNGKRKKKAQNGV